MSVLEMKDIISRFANTYLGIILILLIMIMTIVTAWDLFMMNFGTELFKTDFSEKTHFMSKSAIKSIIDENNGVGNKYARYLKYRIIEYMILALLFYLTTGGWNQLIDIIERFAFVLFRNS